MSKLKSGIELITAERARQVKKEGHTAKHDDGHSGNEIARAACAYVEHYIARSWVFADRPEDYQSATARHVWPWAEIDWNPQDPTRDLVKAGALIAAEIDRLQRASKGKP